MKHGLGLGLASRGGGFRMASLFAGGEDGIVIDRLNPSSGNLFQDAAGTTPVTAAGQPVGLVLDQSQGLVLGPELVVGGWSSEVNWSASGNTASATGATSYGPYITTGVATVGATYEVQFEITEISSGGVYLRVGGTQSQVFTSGGSYKVFLVASAAGNTPCQLRASGTFTGTVDNISVREVPGYHARQSVNDDYRPTLMQDAGGIYYIDHDEIDDELTATLPNLGSSCTIAYVDDSQVTLLENQTVSGNYTLPETTLRGFLLIDRALTAAEQTKVTNYFSRLLPA